MDAIKIGIISVTCISSSIFLGLILKRFLPASHLTNDSRDTIKIGAGAIASLTALVIGLLVGSAKTSFDAIDRGIVHFSAKLMHLDRLLMSEGLEAAGIREELKQYVIHTKKLIWPEGGAHQDLPSFARSTQLDEIRSRISELPARTELQKQLVQEALRVTDDLMQSRWILMEETHGGLPHIFLVVLLLWLFLHYLCFSLIAPNNATAITVLLVCAISMSSAIFMIMELNNPMHGLIQISPASVEKALEVMEMSPSPSR